MVIGSKGEWARKALAIVLSASIATQLPGMGLTRALAEEAEGEDLIAETIEFAEADGEVEQVAEQTGEATDEPLQDTQPQAGEGEAEADGQQGGSEGDASTDTAAADGRQLVSHATADGEADANENWIRFVTVNGDEDAVPEKNCVEITPEMAKGTVKMTGGVYFVRNDLTTENRVEVSGNVTLVIGAGGTRSGATFKCMRGIHVPAGASLTVTRMKYVYGALEANNTGDKEDADFFGYLGGGKAGIGGNSGESSGKITLLAETHAESTSDAAAVGGGEDGNGGGITINADVIVTAHAGGAGIGGGENGNSGPITILGGNVDAKGGGYYEAYYSGGAGIGGGEDGNSDKIEIRNAHVRVDAGYNAAGIGGGDTGHMSGDLHIDHSWVQVERKAFDDETGAGIGGGAAGGDQKGSILIEGGSHVEVDSHGAGAGIGGGCGGYTSNGGDGGKVTIRNSYVKAISAQDGAGIGGGGGGCGACHGGNGGDVVIEGDCMVQAFSNGGKDDKMGSAIGRGKDGLDVGTVKLPDHVRVIATNTPGMIGRNIPVGKYEQDRGELLKGSTVATVAERTPYCYYRNKVLIEACEHEDVHYECCLGNHKAHCKYCKGLDSDTPETHKFDDEEHPDTCTVCGYERPGFEPCTLADDGIGLTFWMKLPKGKKLSDYKNAHLEVQIPGKSSTRTERFELDGNLKRRDDGCYGFSTQVSPIETYEYVTGMLCVDDAPEGLNPEVVRVYGRVSDCATEAFDATQDPVLRGRMFSLVNLGYYLQPYLAATNGWSLDRDYRYGNSRWQYNGWSQDNAKKELAAHAMKVEKDSNAVTKITASMQFKDKVQLDMYITVKPGIYVAPPTLSFEGKTPNIERMADDRIHVWVDGIDPEDFDKKLTFKDWVGGNIYCEMSVLGYANAIMTGKDASWEAQCAMTAIFEYYRAAHDAQMEAQKG